MGITLIRCLSIRPLRLLGAALRLLGAAITLILRWEECALDSMRNELIYSPGRGTQDAGPRIKPEAHGLGTVCARSRSRTQGSRPKTWGPQA